MNKIIFGIIIPLVIIVVLAILGSVETGFSIDENYSDRISVKDAFGNEGLPRSVKVGEINIENDYFLARRYDLPNLGVCLVDSEWKNRPLDAGNLRYSEGDFSPESEFYYDYSNERSIEIGTHDEETVRVYLEPNYIFEGQNYSKLIETYGDYDSLVIYEKEKDTGYYYDYDSCGSLDEDILENGIRINLSF